MTAAIKNLIPPFLSGKTTGVGKTSRREPFAKNFLRLLGKGAKGEGATSPPPQTGAGSVDKLESHIEKLRRALLAHGKSVSRSSIKGEDVLVLGSFLRECGLAQAEADGFMNQLLQKSENGEIKLSRFFEEARKLAAQKQEASKTRLEPSCIPIVESFLRERGVEPRAADRLIENSKTSDGSLDLKRLARGVEKDEDLRATVSRQAKLRSSKSEGQVSENLGNSRPVGAASAHDGLRQLLAEDESIPKKVESAIHQIVEKAVVPEKQQASVTTFSPPALERANLVKPLETGGEGSRRISKNEAAQVDVLGVESSRRLHRSQDASPSRSATTRPNHAPEKEDQGPLPESLSKGRRDRASGAQTESRVFSVQHQHPGTLSPDPATNPAQRVQLHSIPSYILEQVTRQISRSMPESERVVKLLLKPPELGYLTLRIDMKDTTLKLGMRTETSSAQELLISGASELKETLLAQGFKIERMDIQIDEQLRQSFSFSPGAQGEEFMERSSQSRIGQEVTSPGEGGEGPSSTRPGAAGNDHLIDVKV